jgi:hypothetical protein
MLEQIVNRYLVKFYTLTQKYPNPKNYAKVIVKKLQSDTNIATLFTIIYAMHSRSDHIFKPGQINKKLANDIQNTIGQDYINLRLEENGQLKEFLHPRDLREKVFDKLENLGIFVRLEGKEEIRRQEYNKQRPGRKGTYDTEVFYDNHGGRPSAERLDEEVKSLKKTTKKPEALDFLYEKVVRSGLAYRLVKYKMLAILHAVKMDEKIVHKMMGVGASFMKNDIAREDIVSFNILYQGLQLFDDNQIEQMADDISKSLIQDRGYYAILFIGGLLKL